MSKNYYEVLEVAPTADLQTLKKEFHRLSKILHPDTTLLPIDEAARRFRDVCEAYEYLSDPLKREAYDNLLKKPIPLRNQDSEQIDRVERNTFNKGYGIGNRRPLSGGELFSLLLLCIALVVSLLLGIGFALLDGKELQVSPSWLMSNKSIINDVLYITSDVESAVSSNSFESTLLRSD